MSPARFRCATQLVSVQSTLQLIDRELNSRAYYIPCTHCYHFLPHGKQPSHVRAAPKKTISQPHLRYRNLHLQACVSQPQQAGINSSGFSTSDERTGRDIRGSLQPLYETSWQVPSPVEPLISTESDLASHHVLSPASHSTS